MVALQTDLLNVVLPVLVGLVLWVVAGIVARNGWAQGHNRLFALLYFASGLKSMSEGIGLVADSFHKSARLFPDAAQWKLVGDVCAFVLPAVLLLFVMAFPRQPEALARNKGLRLALLPLAFVPSALFAAVFFTSDSDLRSFHTAVLFTLYSCIVTIACLILLLRTRRLTTDRIERNQTAYVVAGFVPSFIVTWIICAIYLMYDGGIVFGTPTLPQAPTQRALDLIIGVFSPAFELLAAGLVAFAILKYNLLGVSPKFRVGVKSFTVGLMLVTVFLLVQFIENVILQGQVFAFAGEYGSFLLSGVSGVVLFKPIEVASNKVSNRLLPKEAEPLGRAAEIYEAQCTYVLRDAQVTEREMQVLRNLRAQLGLNEGQARAIEEKVERRLKVDSPQTGASAGTALRHVAKASDDVSGQAPIVRRASPLPPAAAPKPAVRPPPTAPARPAAPAAPAGGGKAPAKPAAGGPSPVKPAPAKAPGKPPR